MARTATRPGCLTEGRYRTVAPPRSKRWGWEKKRKAETRRNKYNGAEASAAIRSRLYRGKRERKSFQEECCDEVKRRGRRCFAIHTICNSDTSSLAATTGLGMRREFTTGHYRPRARQIWEARDIPEERSVPRANAAPSIHPNNTRGGKAEQTQNR